MSLRLLPALLLPCRWVQVKFQLTQFGTMHKSCTTLTGHSASTNLSQVVASSAHLVLPEGRRAQDLVECGVAKVIVKLIDASLQHAAC